MNARIIGKIATAIVATLPREKVRLDDPRIVSGELLSETQAHEVIASKLQRLFAELERTCDEAADECEGKSESEIRAILRSKFDAVMAGEMQPIPAQRTSD